MADLLLSNEADRSEVWEGKTGVSLMVRGSPRLCSCVSQTPWQVQIEWDPILLLM